MGEIKLKDYSYYSNILIETGTSAGGGVERGIGAGFTDIRSVELSDCWYDYCVAKFGNDNRVTLYHGKSEDCLAKMIPSDRKCVIFLDAHPAGPHTAGHDDLMLNGDESEFHQDRILSKEVQIILRVSGNRDLIIIDDQVGINPLYVSMLDGGYRFEFVEGKYMVCFPK